MLGPNQTKWLAALRSGEYQQGKQYLCREGRYCCLGVGCEVLGVPKTPYEDCVAFNGSISTAPNMFRDLVGLRDFMGVATSGCTLTSLNDVDGKSFSEIADIIESDPSDYFVAAL